MSATPELRAILHSQRANVYYLEYCRVIVRGGRVEYVTSVDKRDLYWNIPIANTTFILLGNGTSITQAAMRCLAQEEVAIGFCGGGGVPLYAAVETLWVTPQSEYQVTEYLHRWMVLWMDETRRLAAAKRLQKHRGAFIEKWWGSRHFTQQGFKVGSLDTILENFEEGTKAAKNQSDLLGYEGDLTKQLYKMAAGGTSYGAFQREHTGSDPANRFLNHGNYLAYGCGAVTTWVLGLHPGLALLHGKTRRGGLVFDFADIIKDGIILPQAFISAAAGHSEKEFRGACLNLLIDLGGLDVMFNTAKDIATCG